MGGKRRVRIGLVLAFAVAASFASYLAGASGAGGAALAPFQYVAKYACSPEVGPVSSYFASASVTQYRTTINVHNPNSVPVTIGKKAVVALRENLQRGTISPVMSLDLKPDEAIAIDCKDIKALLGGVAQPGGDGLVVVYSNTPLDVWAVYTSKMSVSSATGEGLAGNIDVVWVPAQERAA